MRLFDVGLKSRRRTSRELVPVDTRRCPSCGSAVEVVTMDEPLFRHGGHGATRRTIIERCSTHTRCRWALVRSVQEVRPDG